MVYAKITLLEFVILNRSRVRRKFHKVKLLEGLGDQLKTYTIFNKPYGFIEEIKLNFIF